MSATASAGIRNGNETWPTSSDVPEYSCRTELKLSVMFARIRAPAIGWVEFWSETDTVTVCVSPAVMFSEATPMDKSKADPFP